MFSKELIDKTCSEFRVALESMSESGDCLHGFDMGAAASGEMFSLLIRICPRAEADVIMGAFKQIAEMQTVQVHLPGMPEPLLVPVSKEAHSNALTDDELRELGVI